MILLIGYGNSLRRDDGAGLILAERLDRAWRVQGVAVKLLLVHQLTPELVAEIAEPDIATVVFVDTRMAAGEVDPQVQAQPLNPEASSPSLGHHLDPAMLLTYADHLYGRRPLTWLVTAPGVDFGYGEGLSQAAQQALAAADELPAELLARLQIPAVKV